MMTTASLNTSRYLRRSRIPRLDSKDLTNIKTEQDPESSGPGVLPNFLLRLNNDEDVYFYFTFAMRQSLPPSATPVSPHTSAPNPVVGIDTIIKGLTFVFAPTLKDLDALVTREFNADPNLHKNPNVDLVGDYSTDGALFEQFEWSWKWRPPKVVEDRGGGWRNSCGFVEYDQRAHRLNTLITFSFWVQNSGPKREPSRYRSVLLHVTA